MFAAVHGRVREPNLVALFVGSGDSGGRHYRHGKPAGVMIGVKPEDDWFDYRLENDSRFMQRVELARRSLHPGEVVKLQDVK